MGQSECLKVLKRDEWMTARQIGIVLGQQPSVVIQSLNRLSHSHDVIMKKIRTNGKQEITLWHGKEDES